MNETHAPERTSWVESARDPDTDFPVQNLPLGVAADGTRSRIVVAIGDQALDLRGAVDAGLLDGLPHASRTALGASVLNEWMALPATERSGIRSHISDLLGAEAEASIQERARPLLHPIDQLTLAVPARVGDYTDFYASIDHATRVGSLFRPDNPLLPNYRWIPIGYHGRASSIVADGARVIRPKGQRRPEADGEPPAFGASTRLDYEVEVGAWVGPGNALGAPIGIEEAGEHLAGISLLNDWSARDLQGWEYQPLGPFLGKSFATSVSPWVITADALIPFRRPARPRGEGEPAPLPYLDSPSERDAGGIDLVVEAWLRTEAMRRRDLPAFHLSSGHLGDLYWTIGQMIAHHSSNGCNLGPGDLLGTGTVSGPDRGARGCLLEITSGGREPISLPSGEERRFLEDGDEVILRGRCPGRDGVRGIGLGSCAGIVVGAGSAG